MVHIAHDLLQVGGRVHHERPVITKVGSMVHIAHDLLQVGGRVHHERPVITKVGSHSS